MNIAIVGPQCAGKTTFAKATGFEIVKFAEPLYAVNRAIGVKKNRSFMQEFSDLVKAHFGRNYFINKFARLTEAFPDRQFVCDDVRYSRELNYLKNRGWSVVYIDADEAVRRTRATRLGLEFLPDHPSESGVAGLADMCDVYLDNSHLQIDDLEKMAQLELINNEH